MNYLASAIKTYVEQGNAAAAATAFCESLRDCDDDEILEFFRAALRVLDPEIRA